MPICTSPTNKSWDTSSILGNEESKLDGVCPSGKGRKMGKVDQTIGQDPKSGCHVSSEYQRRRNQMVKSASVLFAKVGYQSTSLRSTSEVGTQGFVGDLSK